MSYTFESKPTEPETPYFVEWSPSWEANSHWANQKVPSPLWHPKAVDTAYKSQPLATNLIKINSIQTNPPNFPDNLTLHFPGDIFHSGFPTKMLYSFLISHECSSALLLRPWFDHQNNNTEHYTLLSSSSRNSVLCHYLPLTSNTFPPSITG